MEGSEREPGVFESRIWYITSYIHIYIYIHILYLSLSWKSRTKSRQIKVFKSGFSPRKVIHLKHEINILYVGNWNSRISWEVVKKWTLANFKHLVHCSLSPCRMDGDHEIHLLGSSSNCVGFGYEQFYFLWSREEKGKYIKRVK